MAFNPTSGMVIVADVGNDAIRAVAFDTGATTTLGLVSDSMTSCVTVNTATGAGVLECVTGLTSGLAVDPNTGVVFVTGTDYSLRYIGCASGFGAVGTSCSGCSAGTAGGVGGVCSVCPVGRFTAMDFSAGDPFSAQCDLCADLTFAYGTEAADHRACGTCSAGTWPGAESCEPCYNSRVSCCRYLGGSAAAWSPRPHHHLSPPPHSIQTMRPCNAPLALRAPLMQGIRLRTTPGLPRASTSAMLDAAPG